MTTSDLHTELDQMSKLSTAQPKKRSSPVVTTDLIAALYMLPDPTLTPNTPCAKQYSNSFVAFRALFSSRIVARYLPAATSFLGLISREAGRRWRLIRHTPLETEWTAYAARSRRECAPNPKSRASRRLRARGAESKGDFVQYEYVPSVRKADYVSSGKLAKQHAANASQYTFVTTTESGFSLPSPSPTTSPSPSSSSFSTNSCTTSSSPSYGSLQLSPLHTSMGLYSTPSIPQGYTQGALSTSLPAPPHSDFSAQSVSQLTLSDEVLVLPNLALFGLDGVMPSSQSMLTDIAPWECSVPNHDVPQVTSQALQYTESYYQWMDSSFDPNATFEF